MSAVKMLNLDLLLLMVNAAATLFMTGLIWFVQIVHYPLFDSVGVSEFLKYGIRHRSLTTLVVAGPMIIEITTALFLALTWKRAYEGLIWLGFFLVVGIWISTLLCSIPCHEKLCTGGYSLETHRWLMNSNWVRTLLWTARALILLFIIYKQITISE